MFGTGISASDVEQLSLQSDEGERRRAARLWSLDTTECEIVLSRMVTVRVLRETKEGYAAGHVLS